MKAYTKIKNKIQEEYSALPKNQKEIANFFLENFDRLPFLCVQEISEATAKSVASVVRFAQRLGFSGFSQLRNEIANSLQNKLNNKEFFPLFDKHKIKDDTLTFVANQDIQNINETLNLIDREKFSKTIDEIIKAKRVFTMGLGISSFLSQIMAYQLTLMAIDARPLNYNIITFVEQALFLTKDDLLIAFSFPPYSRETIDAAKYANSRGLKLISITNKNSSPITFYSTISLIVKSENLLYTNSYAALSVLINAIATECAIRNKTNSQKVLKEFNKIYETYKNIII